LDGRSHSVPPEFIRLFGQQYKKRHFFAKIDDWRQCFAGSSVSKETGSLGMETALMKFCREMPCSPERLLKTAYGIRNFRSVEMDRLFIKTEMYLKSKTTSAISSIPPKNTLGPRSRSSDLLPTSQSQINIQMMSHTLTIREVNGTILERFVMERVKLTICCSFHRCSFGCQNGVSGIEFSRSQTPNIGSVSAARSSFRDSHLRKRETCRTARCCTTLSFDF
jgi:hypothetical protein